MNSQYVLAAFRAFYAGERDRATEHIRVMLANEQGPRTHYALFPNRGRA